MEANLSNGILYLSAECVEENNHIHEVYKDGLNDDVYTKQYYDNEAFIENNKLCYDFLIKHKDISGLHLRIAKYTK